MQAWDSLQLDVFKDISHELNFNTADFMALRAVSRHWGWLTDQGDDQHLHIPATLHNLSKKITALHNWREARKLVACGCNFVISRPVMLIEAARLMEELTLEVR